MRASDTLVGAVVALIGLALTLGAWGLPDLPGQSYGAATFPVTVGFGLLALGAVLTVKGVFAGAPISLGLTDWGLSRRSWVRLSITIGAVIVYIVFADSIGFLLAGTGLVLVLLMVFGTHPALAIPLAPVATYAVAWAFGNVLRVPLPRGLLAGLW